ncbi:MAG: DUF4254 domain-containing protein [Elusimicrobiales bacterium]|jgi:uncharacterized coiled-coil DUF342 family protein|nr:DUF4254 domain-containing protein [Elusimicrobiales bacterium]
MAETIGSITDKISIIQLKIFHMKEQLQRTDVTEEFKSQINNKISVLNEQKKDLEDELTELFYDVFSGKRKLKVYRQFKMYNDPSYRIKK